MADGKDSAVAVAELLLKISRTVDAAANASDLNPAQWAALRYLGQAAPSARTNRAFAAFHQTTTGTVAVTFKNLVDKGLIERTQSVTDKRQAQFDLTNKGSLALDADPLCGLVHAITSLPPEDQQALIQGVTELMLTLSESQ